MIDLINLDGVSPLPLQFIVWCFLFQHKSPARRKYSFGSTNSQCSDDDDSDVASISSERSYSSRGSSRSHRHKILQAGTVSLILERANSLV